MKKALSLGIVSLIAISTLSSFTYANEDGRRMLGSGSAGSGKVIDLTCAHDVVVARENSVRAAYQDLSNALLSALDVRVKELGSAWTITNPTNRRVARDAAWSNWRNSAKTARDAFKSSRKAAWDTFRTSMKACNAPSSEIDNNMIQAMDVQ